VIRIVVADDEHLIREALVSLLGLEDDLEVVAQAASGDEALAVARKHAPDVAVLDLQMPGLSGTEVAAALASELPGCACVIVTSHGLPGHLKQALAVGVRGFVPKTISGSGLAAVIRTVHAGDAVIAPSSTRRLLEHLATALPDPGASSELDARLDQLTEREREVLVLMARGRSNSEIASELFVGEATVKTHVGRILAKLGARDRVQAVVAAYDSGLVQPHRG